LIEVVCVQAGPTATAVLDVKEAHELPGPNVGSSLLLLFVSLLTFPTVTGSCRAADRDDSTRPLVWAADAEGGAPYIFKDPKDPTQYLGFEKDIADALSRELKRPIQFRQYEYINLISGLERGDFDFAMNGLEITADRQRHVLFSQPYYVYKLQLVVRAGEERLPSLEACRGRKDVTIGTLSETAAERLLHRMGIPVKAYSDQVLPYKDLSQRAIDGVLLDLPIAVYYAQKDPALKFAGDPVEPGVYAIAFNKKDEKLAHDVDAALERLIENRELRLIYEKWGIWNEDQKRLKEPLDLVAESARKYSFSGFFPQLLDGAKLTVLISVLSMLLAISLGLPIALARLYGPAPLRWLATGYVEFFRGIPILLLLFFLYFGLPGIAQAYDLPFSLKLRPLEAAILGFGLNYAAYEAEIYRAGLGAIPLGQWEAAASLGLSSALTFRRIILPQAIRGILPPMTNDFVALFKDTSVVSIIALEELTKQYQILTKSSLQYLEIGLATAALYLIMSVPLGHLSRYLEARWGTEA
jgi:polar amino acid transport system substrate-binding protein